MRAHCQHSGTLLYLTASLFWQPSIPGFSGLHAPDYCFLVSRTSLDQDGDTSKPDQRHIIFDLGTRPDWENYSPATVSLIKRTTIVIPDNDVATLLDSDESGLNVKPGNVEAIIWSHNHFDHVGNTAAFPSSTDLVVGPGVMATSRPGWPTNEHAMMLDSDISGRRVRELTFDQANERVCKVGHFDAYDYFGDGSFYLLDAPGHCKGHMCGLARTKGDDAPGGSTFVFMGADACHHVGVLRPSPYIPLPDDLRLRDMAIGGENRDIECSADMVQGVKALTLDHGPTTAFFEVANGALFPDHKSAMDTVARIQELDAAESILVIIAHDGSIRDHVPTFPAKINDWREDNLKHKTRWLFLRDLEGTLKHRSKERPAGEPTKKEQTRR